MIQRFEDFINEAVSSGGNVVSRPISEFSLSMLRKYNMFHYTQIRLDKYGKRINNKLENTSSDTVRYNVEYADFRENGNRTGSKLLYPITSIVNITIPLETSIYIREHAFSQLNGNDKLKLKRDIECTSISDYDLERLWKYIKAYIDHDRKQSLDQFNNCTCTSVFYFFNDPIELPRSVIYEVRNNMDTRYRSYEEYMGEGGNIEIVQEDGVEKVKLLKK